MKIVNPCAMSDGMIFEVELARLSLLRKFSVDVTTQFGEFCATSMDNLPNKRTSIPSLYEDINALKKAPKSY
jgi:hypothetical protein